MATGSGDTNARLWDLFTETPSHVLSGHKGWVLCVEWEAMERKLATGGHDGHVGLMLLSLCQHNFTLQIFRSGYGIRSLASLSGMRSKAIQNG